MKLYQRKIFQRKESLVMKLSDILFEEMQRVPPEGYVVVVSKGESGRGISIKFRTSNKVNQSDRFPEGRWKYAGEIHIQKGITADNNKLVWEVESVNADKGYGPTLYDIAMSYVAPKYLMADRRDVSDAAKRVWAHTFENRLGEYDTIEVTGENDVWKDKEGKEIPSLNQAYRLKKKLPIYSSVVVKDKQFFANERDRNKREEMLSTLEEQAWTYFRNRMQ